MKPLLFWGGLGLAGSATLAGQFLPSAPAAIQGNAVLQPIGSFLIAQQTLLVLIGLVLIVVSLFL